MPKVLTTSEYRKIENKTAKKNKTFKIGERAIGGIIKVQINGKIVIVEALDWNTKKVVSSGSIIVTDFNAKVQLDKYLNELTCYHLADKIYTWVIENITYPF